MSMFKRKPSLAIDEFATLVRGIRLDLNMSQREFARQCDTTQNCVWKWEHGMNLPTPHTLARIIAVSNLTFEQMFSEIAQIYTRDLYDQTKAFYEDIGK